MASPANALQAGIYTRLVNYSPLTTALGGAKVYDHVPQGTSGPYVLIGDATVLDWSTKTEAGWEFTVTLHAWDFEVAGRKSVNALLAHVYDALHLQEASITVTGFTLVQIRLDNEVPAFPEQVEGQTDHYYHGVTRFRATLQA